MMEDAISPRLQPTSLFDPNGMYQLDENDECSLSYLERKSTVLSNVT